MPDPKAHLVVALLPEARPLIRALSLRQAVSATRRNPFPIFDGDDACLVLSGIGKVAAAGATATLAAYSEQPEAAWLNVGIAGHSRLGVGEAMVAYEIRDRANGAGCFPPQLFDVSVPGGKVITVDEVERAMEEDAAYEMEASGYASIARRFSTAELVQVVKVVSDGPDSDLEALTARRIEELITGRLESILELVASLRGLAGEAFSWQVELDGVEELLERWHFTVSDELELRRQLRRHRLLAPEEALPLEGLSPSTRGREVNRRLRAWLDSLCVERTFDPSSAES